MSESLAAHLPGALVVRYETPNLPAAVATLNGRLVAVMYGDSREERTARAEFFAAAPETAAERHHLAAVNGALLAAAKEAQCQCSLRERASGHLAGCWMPDLLAAIAEAEAPTTTPPAVDEVAVSTRLTVNESVHLDAFANVRGISRGDAVAECVRLAVGLGGTK